MMRPNMALLLVIALVGLQLATFISVVALYRLADTYHACGTYDYPCRVIITRDRP